MESYRIQQLSYLIVPVTLGVDFFLTARAERLRENRVSVKSVTMNALGYVFIALVPLLFFLTILSVDYKHFPLFRELFHRLDRYGVMFCFLGSWWQVFLITALRAMRTNALQAGDDGKFLVSVWVPYILLGSLISALVLSVAPWNLMWVSIFFFLASGGVLAVVGVSARTLAKIFLVLAFFVFICENILFIVLDAIV